MQLVLPSMRDRFMKDISRGRSSGLLRIYVVLDTLSGRSEVVPKSVIL